MENKMKKNIVISFTILIVVTLILLGLTYAYYRTRIIGNTETDKSISVTSKLLEIVYSDEIDTLVVENARPGYSTTKEFTVTNNSDEKIAYSVILDNVETDITRINDWTFQIKKNNVVVAESVLTNEKMRIYNSEIDIDSVDTYTFVLTYNNSPYENQTVDMGKTLSFKFDIIDNNPQKFDTATEGSLLYAIKNNSIVSDPVTTPGQTASESDEAVLANTIDDDGTSYYFRGNVKNNFINYSGMCWRIVRVQGDGSIKLVLADKDNECNSENYDLDNTSSAFIVSASYTYAPSQPLPSFLVFDNSNLKAILNSWVKGENYVFNEGATLNFAFNKKINSGLLINAKWCNDLSISNEVVGDMGTTIDYNSKTRLLDVTSAEPTLKCDRENSTLVTNEVGVLTADEYAFAGAAYGIDNSTFYLIKNASSEKSLTMTPFNYTPPASPYNLYISTTGSIKEETVNWNSAGIRPSIVISSSALLVDGNGTQEKPYIVF